MTDDPITLDADLFDEIQSLMDVSIDDPRLPWNGHDLDRYADFIAGSQPELKTDALDNVTRRYAERLEYHLRGAWRAGYEYVHVYEAGPELARPELDETFTFQRAYLPSNDPPAETSGRYLFSYDIGAVDDAELREAIEP